MSRIAAMAPSGIAENRFRAARVTTGSVAGAGEATVTVTWATAFADTNYTVVATVVHNSTVGVYVERILTQTASAITVRVKNEDAINPLTGTLHAIAIHDA